MNFIRQFVRGDLAGRDLASIQLVQELAPCQRGELRGLALGNLALCIPLHRGGDA